ncbi:MAG: hypothetical protein N4A63_05735 [Vallitalea sp.]|jgi:hypothetical protein|nr:hypothetical protein [Vallitalea sp.]
MNVNMSTNANSVNIYNNSINNNNNTQNKNNLLTKFEKQVSALDKRIQSLKENDKISSLEKQEKIKQLEKQKQELMQRINEEKIKEKTKEMEEKIEEAEEIADKKNEKGEKPLTPLDEVKAELGIENLSSRTMIKASNALDVANHKMNMSRNLNQEAKILDKEIETDIGRGHGILNDFRSKLSSRNKINARRIENESMKELGKVNKLVEKSSEKIEKAKEEDKEVKNKIKDKEGKEINKDNNSIKQKDIKIGENIDILL